MRDLVNGDVLLRLRQGAWWLHPAWTILMAVAPGLVIAWLAGDELFRSWWRTQKYFDSADAALMALLLAVFVAATCLPMLRRRRGEEGGAREGVWIGAAQQRLIRRAGLTLTVLTLTAYSLWWLVALSRGLGPAQLTSALAMEPGGVVSVKRMFKPVGGVTTATQFGPPAIACLFIDRRLGGGRHTLPIAALLLMGVMRAWLQAERLALIELVVPLFVIMAVLAPQAKARIRPWMWALVPLAAPVLLVVVFGTFEYTRSWNDYYSQSGMGYGEFVLQRLGGYYATANNNSAMLLTYLVPLMNLPYYTVAFLWNLPGMGAFGDIRTNLGVDPVEGWKSVLWRYGNPEFNNEGGLLTVVADYGAAGAVVWVVVAGLLIGLCHHAIRRGDVRGLLVYPVIYVGLIELARYLYWGQGRAFPSITAAVVIGFLAHAARQKDAGPRVLPGDVQPGGRHSPAAGGRR